MRATKGRLVQRLLTHRVPQSRGLHSSFRAILPRSCATAAASTGLTVRGWARLWVSAFQVLLCKVLIGLPMLVQGDAAVCLLGARRAASA